MPAKKLRHTGIKIKEDGTIFPWFTNKAESVEDSVIVISQADSSSLPPFESHQNAIDQELKEILENTNNDFNELMKSLPNITQPRRLSIPEVQLMKPVPITPHTKKSRRVRARKNRSSGFAESNARTSEGISADTENTSADETDLTSKPKKPKRSSTRKKPPIAVAKRSTRSSKSNTSTVVMLPEIQEIPDGDTVEDKMTPVPRERKKAAKRVKMNVPESPLEADEVPQVTSETPKETTNEIEQDSLATPEPMDGVKENDSPQDSDKHQSPIEVQQLISLHETLIEKQHQSASAQQPASQSEKTSKGDNTPEPHASPILGSKDVETSDKPSSSRRSIEEQVLSCMKKKPIVNVAKLKMGELSPKMAVDSPQRPITLTFDVSDDEEDIADSIDESAETVLVPVDNKPQTIAEKLPHTPLGTATNTICPPRRSLHLQLRLSSGESDLDTSMAAGTVEEDENDMETEPQPLPDEDSLENDGGNQSNDTITTVSQASSSVCSSSAATVILESDFNTVNESQDICSETEHEEPARDPSPEVRRSTRLGKRKSVVSGLAAKRKSQSAKLTAKRQAADAKAYEESVVAASSNEEAECSDSGVEKEIVEVKRPKIPKPVIRPPRKLKPSKPPTSSSANRVIPRISGKRNRNLENGESPGPQSPAQPKTKQMRCASPLCSEKSKTKPPPQRSRNTFLNRSTAASRSRRTPGRPSPASSRTRAALLAGSPFKFTSKAIICLSPVQKPANLTADVQSFIRRNTPQKINFEEQLAAKKEQLELKTKREEEAKLRKQEEKQRKIREKKRKQEERERRAAEQRERREREQKEKQQKLVDQWEKRVADVDKVKVIRKKEETAKAKKLQKKMVEAEEIRRKEEEDRIRKLKEQEQEKEQRHLEQIRQKEQEAASKKQAEQEKLLEKQRQDKLREEKEAEETRKKLEEEKLKRDDEEKAKRKKAEEAQKLKLQKIDREEAERKKKLQDEIEKRNAEAARLEQERLEKEKEAQRRIQEEAQRRQEEAIRRKEKEEARKRKLAEAKAAAEEKAKKRKQEEIARTEELRRKREEIRRQAEQRREEERAQREEEKRVQEEEKRKQRQQAEKEKLRQIQESNERLRKLEEEHQMERDRLRAMNQNAAMDKSLRRTPGQNSTYTLDPNSTNHGSPQSYDITPQVQKFAPSTEDDYNIQDLASDDSTDDDEAPRKVVPKWAKGSYLRAQLIKQYYTPPDMEVLFRNAMNRNGVRLDEIFKSCKSRYFKRTSSAHWNSPIMPVGHISFTDQCRGFDYSTS